MFDKKHGLNLKAFDECQLDKLHLSHVKFLRGSLFFEFAILQITKCEFRSWAVSNSILQGASHLQLTEAIFSKLGGFSVTRFDYNGA